MTAAIEARDLTKTYGSGRGIAGATLTVAPGEKLGFLGPNGAGKTTFIRLVLGLLRPDTGSVRIMGHDVATARMRALAEVGYLPGELELLGGLSGTRTLDVLARLHPRPPSLRGELCEVLGLPARDLRRRVREYSRGMKQKLALVSALQHDPPVAILDEPTGGLDPVVQLRLLDWLDGRARAGRTVVLSSHVLAEVESLCDRVAMVRDGVLLPVRALGGAGLGGMRSVAVRFAGPTDPGRYRVDGVGAVEIDGGVHRFTLAAPPAPLLERLAGLGVTDLVMEPLRLEDAFRELYDGVPGPAPAPVGPRGGIAAAP